MTEFTVDIPNLNELVAAFQRAPEIFMAEFAKAFLSVKIALAENTKANTPYDQGYLGNPANWGFTPEPLKATWFPTATYAPDVQFGTAPHFVSAATIAVWAGRKGLNPYAVAKSIAKKGTRAQPFMQDIADAATPRITEVFAQALDNITQQIAKQ